MITKVLELEWEDWDNNRVYEKVCHDTLNGVRSQPNVSNLSDIPRPTTSKMGGEVGYHYQGYLLVGLPKETMSIPKVVNHIELLHLRPQGLRELVGLSIARFIGDETWCSNETLDLPSLSAGQDLEAGRLAAYSPGAWRTNQNQTESNYVAFPCSV